jgi:hypothetical protein
MHFFRLVLLFRERVSRDDDEHFSLSNAVLRFPIPGYPLEKANEYGWVMEIGSNSNLIHVHAYKSMANAGDKPR